MSDPARLEGPGEDEPSGVNGVEGGRESHASDEGVELARRTRALTGIGTAAWSFYAIHDLVLARWATAAIHCTATLAGGVLLLWLAWRPRSARLVMNLAILSSVLSLSAVAVLCGNVRSTAIWYLAIAPLCAGYALGMGGAIAWSMVAGAAIGVVELSRRLFPGLPDLSDPNGAIWARIAVLLVIVLGFALAMTRSHRQQVTVLEQREGVIRNLLGGLSKNNEELLLARDTAVAAARAKGEFLAMMSHEIRTPLNAVLGLTGILLDAQLAPEQRELVRTIRSSGDSLLLLLNDILDFSKIEAGRLQLERAPFDIADCAEDALDLFATVATEKGLDLSCVISPDVPPRIEGDAGRVRQILVNLVSNAIKFTPRGSIQVRIDSQPKAAEGDHADDTIVHCSVRDTGIGIPESHLSALFQPFSQVDPSTTRRFGGTGLGLAICRTLAERMGGRVWAESKARGGSTFHFTVSARGIAHVLGVESVADIHHTVLVVSPREGTRAAVRAQLESLGLRVLECERPSEMEEAASVRPDVVVADEAVSAIEAQSALGKMHRQPAFVLLSTAGRDSVARRALREQWGAGPLIVAMPVRRAALREAVLHAVGLDETPPPRSSGVLPLAIELPLRILIAEDNPVNQRVALLLLERLGYRADVVGNGAEAIEAVRARSYDVVLMDVRMPEVDGIEATQRIRAEVAKDHQPRIVALTANAMSEDRKVCVEAGMDDFLSKPITGAELERALRGATGRQPPPDPEGSLGPKELDALRRLTEGSPELLKQLIDEYLEAAARLVATIQEAVGRHDAKEVERAAHSLKGSSGQMGAQHLMLESAVVERAASLGDLSLAGRRLPALVEKHKLTQKRLVAVRDAVFVSDASVEAK